MVQPLPCQSPVAFRLQSASEEALIIGQEEKSTAFFRFILQCFRRYSNILVAVFRPKPGISAANSSALF